MNNTSVVQWDDTQAVPAVLPTMATEVDDDENDADLDDEDDLAPACPERWAAYPGFGSPQWWAHS